MSRVFKSALAALLLGAAFTPAAFARTSPTEMSITIAYGDLDLSNIEGGMTLLRRIKGAARKVCNAATSPSLLTPRAEIVCRRHTVEIVVRQLDIEALTTAWNGRASPPTSLASR